MGRTILAVCLASLLLGAAGETEPKYPPTSLYQRQTIEGWSVLVHRDLLDKHPDLADKVLRHLKSHLYQISYMLPEGAVVKLQQVPIWVEYKNRPEKHPCMCYHPSAQWLKENDFNPDKAGSVELAGAETFLQWTKDQPWMVFHELAHAYHHQVLGYGHPEIRKAYRKAKESGAYESVLHINGSTRRHYAMNNDQEYFAETAEAFFGTNDFYPFTRAELKQHDPDAYELHKKLWK
ncbi:MAG: hypothetical protein JW828_01285 [Sedimentisphaerales bacterium]|nr:hypothetical protein [Sedimentisphaerales bacterium]